MAFAAKAPVSMLVGAAAGAGLGTALVAPELRPWTLVVSVSLLSCGWARACWPSPETVRVLETLTTIAETSASARHRPGRRAAIWGELEGMVAARPWRPRPGEIRVVVDGVFAHEARGRFEVSLPDLPWSVGAKLHRGDTLRGRARLEMATDDVLTEPFSYRAYLYRKGIAASGKLYEGEIVRDGEAGKGVYDSLLRRLSALPVNADARATLLAVVLGERSLIGEHTKELFRRTGTSHFLVVSGYHLGVIFAATCAAISAVGLRINSAVIYLPLQKLAAVAGLAVASGYALVVGLELTVVRSLVALFVYTVAQVLGRRTAPGRVLLGAMLVVLLIWPGAFLEASFQLTFSALFGLLIARKLGQESVGGGLSWRQARRAFVEVLRYNWWAWLCTAPVVLCWFGSLSPSAPLINAVIVTPFSLPAVVGGGVAILWTALGAPGHEELFGACCFVYDLLLQALELASMLAEEHGIGAREFEPGRARLLAVWLGLVALLAVGRAAARGRSARAGERSALSAALGFGRPPNANTLEKS